MPRKTKFTREQLLDTAFEIVRSEGINALSARNIANKLNSSVCPVFTQFKNMSEVEEEVKKKARALYTSYIDDALAQQIAFKSVGMNYIKFAHDEPRLFQLLYMTRLEKKPPVMQFIPTIESNYEKILQSVTKNVYLTEEQAKVIYLHLCIYTHGIATFYATDMCDFKEDEVDEMLQLVFKGIYKELKESEK